MFSRISLPLQQQQRRQLVISQHQHHRRLASSSSSSSSSSFLLPRPSSSSSSSSSFHKERLQSQPLLLQKSLDHVMNMCRSYDPAGYLPGQLLPTLEMQITYYAVRSFWVETGLRIGSTVPRLSKKRMASTTPEEQLEWWRAGIEGIYEKKHVVKEEEEEEHPTLRLLRALHYHRHPREESEATTAATGTFTKCHFDDILDGRKTDLELKQYPTLTHLEHHAMQSCGSLAQLVLESAGVYQKDHPITHSAAKSVGTCHGLTNALRMSIPVVSTTGRLIVPQDLCEKYDVKTPRYLLSALGQGDTVGLQAMRFAVRDIVEHAREHLETARDLREEILLEVKHENHNHDTKHSSNENNNNNGAALAVLLPGLASETFLNRLEAHDFDLTNRDLRNVSWLEHARCSARMIQGYYQQTY
jgi:phytoene/squalene synthetase